MGQKQFLERLALLAKACGHALDEEMIPFYDKVFAKIGYDLGCKAVGEVLMRRRGRDSMPSVGDLVRLVAPEVDPEDQAVEAANRIVEAVTKFGWCNETAAQEFVGDVGWYVVQRNGGWQNVCSTMQANDVKVWTAQFRALALSAVRRAKAGQLQLAPSFNQPSGVGSLPSPVKSIVDSTMQKLGGTHGNVREGEDRAGDSGATQSGQGAQDSAG